MNPERTAKSTDASQASSAQGKTAITWLNAFDDPVAGIKTFANGIDSGGLDGTGEASLVITDLSNKLKVYSGVSLASEHILLEPPVACCVYYIDDSIPRIPVVAVATTRSVYLYRGGTLRPFVRFALPASPIHERELEVWQTLSANGIDPSQAQSRLRDLRQRGLAITQRSSDLVDAETGVEAAAIAAKKLQEPMPKGVRSSITCMSSIPKMRDDAHSTGCLVIGTESGQVLVLNPGASAVYQKVQSLRAAPMSIVCAGALDVDCRIVVACRNRCIHILRGGDPVAATGSTSNSSQSLVIELESQIVSVAIVGKLLFVACMDSTIQAFSLRSASGRRSFSLFVPSPIVCLETLSHPLSGSKALLVALSNSEVRLYSGTNNSTTNDAAQQSSTTQQQSQAIKQSAFLGSLKLPSPAVAMKYGQYGRERGSLMIVCQSGALAVRMMSRTSSDLTSLTVSAQTPAEQEIPLKVPKKTSLYVEQAQHERENAAEMHRVFQRDLYKLRLAAARSYVRVMTDQQGPVSHFSGSALRLSARVQGLGPTFRLRLLVENTGRRAIRSVPVVLSFNPKTYRISRPHGELPVLVPGLPYHFDTKITCLDERGATGEPITVLVCSAGSTLPVIMAVVQMPS